MANTTIKITQLPNIGNNLGANTLLPVVDTTGIAVTDKVTVGNVANYVLSEAGNTLPAAFVSQIAYSVSNSNQPNITSVGTLNVDTLQISGGTNGQYLQTDGTGNLAWVTGTGSGNGTVGGSNTQIQYNDSGNFGGEAAFTYDKTTNRMTVGNVTITSNVSADYMTLTHDLHANVVYGNYLYGDGSNITNLSVGAGSYIENGSSNVRVASGANVTVSVAGNANIISVTGTGANIAGTLSVSGNANVGNLGATGVIVTTVSATGNANVGNVNANIVAANTANIVGNITVANANVTATANLHNLNVSNIANLGYLANVKILGGTNGYVLSTNGSGGLSWVAQSGGSTTANVAFNGTQIFIEPGATETGITLEANIEGWAYLNIPNDATANISDVRLHNDAGNVQIAAGQFSTSGPLYSWQFNNQGSIDIPSQSASFTKGRLQSANGYPTLLGYGSGGHGGPELDWMNGNDPQDMSNVNVIRNSMYLNDEILYIGMNENGNALPTFRGNWTFDAAGYATKPYNVVENTTNGVVCNAGGPTVIYTATNSGRSTIKLLLQVEGMETLGQQWDTQSCEMIVARGFRNNTVVGSVYGLVYTSTNPLATFNAAWNATTNLVEITCTPTSLTFGVEARVHVIELTTSA